MDELLIHLESPYAVAAGTQLRAALEKPPMKVPREVAVAHADVQQRTEALAALRATPEGPSAQQLDWSTDRVTVCISEIPRAVLEAYVGLPLPLSPAQQARLDAARTINGTFFPGGPTGIIHLSHVREWEALKRLLDQAQSDPLIVAAVQTLGMGEDIALLRTLHQRFGERLGLTRVDAAPDETKLLSDWHQAYGRLLTMAGYHELKGTKGLKDLVITPYLAQVALQAADRGRARARRTLAADVGGDPTAAVQTPAAAATAPPAVQATTPAPAPAAATTRKTPKAKAKQPTVR